MLETPYTVARPYAARNGGMTIPAIEVDLDLDGTYQSVVFRSPHSVWVSACLVLATNALLFIPGGIWNADLSIAGIYSKPQLLGMLLVFSLVPMWMISCFFLTQRHTLALAQQLDKITGDDTQSSISAKVLRAPVSQIFAGLAAGLAYALLFNVPAKQASYIFEGHWLILSIVVAQAMLWGCVGILLFVRLHVAGHFSRLGGTIDFSLFDQRTLKAFARVGLLDVVIVVGGLAIATVQSLDAQFRLENYLSGIFVAAPAAVVLLIRPMWKLHKRMKQRKETLLDEIDEMINSVPQQTRLDDMRVLEDLLQRRDRVNALHTWPLDIGIWRRLLFYILIPPMAWAGAALMEVGVNRAIGL